MAAVIRGLFHGPATHINSVPVVTDRYIDPYAGTRRNGVGAQAVARVTGTGTRQSYIRQPNDLTLSPWTKAVTGAGLINPTTYGVRGATRVSMSRAIASERAQMVQSFVTGAAGTYTLSLSVKSDVDLLLKMRYALVVAGAYIVAFNPTTTADWTAMSISGALGAGVTAEVRIGYMPSGDVAGNGVNGGTQVGAHSFIVGRVKVLKTA